MASGKDRKRPKQARSKATVDAIVEATGQVFEKRGFRKTTTTRVAERAGVSVGSLYQYFPDKKQLIAAFFERRLEQDVEFMQALMARAGSVAPDELLSLAAEEMVRLYREDRELYVSVVEILPIMEQTEEVRAGLAQAVSVAAAYLRSQPELTADRDPDLLALLIFHALRGALNSVVAHAPEKLDDVHLPEILAGGVMGFLGRAT